MTTKKFLNALGNIDAKYVNEAIYYSAARKKTVWVKWAAVAACFCLTLIIAIPMIENSDPYPTHTTVKDKETNEAGGVNGKINVSTDIILLGEEYAISDGEAFTYLSTVHEGISNDLSVSGVSVSNLRITEKGYSFIRTGDDGNSMAVNWRDYLAYDGDELVAIIHVTKDETGIKHFLSFGGIWFSHYNELLKKHLNEELVYIYIGDVDAFITPDNEVISLSGTDVSSTIEEDREYYEFFKTRYNTYIP